MKRVFGMVSTSSSREYTPVALRTFHTSGAFRDGDHFVLIDNDGHLDEGEISREFPWLEFIRHSAPASFAENANLVLARARAQGADFWFLNNDIAFMPGWAEAVDTSFPAISLPLCNTDLELKGEDFASKQVMDLGDYLGRETAVERQALARQKTAQGYRGVLSTAFFCVRIHPEVYQAVGDFDTRFGPGGAEDTDYALRCALQGFPVVQALQSWILHFVGRSTWRGAENKEQTERRNKAYLEAFKLKWGEALMRLALLKDPSPLQRHPELPVLYKECSFRRVVARLYPEKLPESLLWNPEIVLSPADVSGKGGHLVSAWPQGLSRAGLWDCHEYAADRRQVRRWLFPGHPGIVLEQAGAGAQAPAENMPEALVRGLSQGPLFGGEGSLPLSLCMIAKNEVLNLGSCLRSVRGLVSEVIVVDTGSNDGTQALAEAYGARLVHCAWEGDFSKARNLGLEQAEQPWILVLDGDEGLLPEDAQALRELLRSKPEAMTGYTLLQNSSSDGGKTGILVSIVRLFPRRPELRYEWPVHEQPVTSMERAGIPVTQTSIRILHTGYADASRNRDKQRRNLAILRNQILSGDSGRPITHFLMASSLVDLKEYAEALAAFSECRRLGRAESEISQGALVGACLCLVKLSRHREALELMQTQAGAASHPKLLGLRGECELALGRADAARTWFERVLNCRQQATIPPCNLAVEKSSALLQLANLWHSGGKPALGVAILKLGLECRKTGIDCRPEMLAELYARHLKL